MREAPKDKHGRVINVGDLVRWAADSPRRIVGGFDHWGNAPVRLSDGVKTTSQFAAHMSFAWEILSRGAPDDEVPESYEPARDAEGRPVLDGIAALDSEYLDRLAANLYGCPRLPSETDEQLRERLTAVVSRISDSKVIGARDTRTAPVVAKTQPGDSVLHSTAVPKFKEGDVVMFCRSPAVLGEKNERTCSWPAFDGWGCVVGHVEGYMVERGIMVHLGSLDALTAGLRTLQMTDADIVAEYARHSGKALETLYAATVSRVRMPNIDIPRPTLPKLADIQAAAETLEKENSPTIDSIWNSAMARMREPGIVPPKTQPTLADFHARVTAYLAEHAPRARVVTDAVGERKRGNMTLHPGFVAWVTIDGVTRDIEIGRIEETEHWIGAVVGDIRKVIADKAVGR